jgi:hypothetical protein
MHAIAAVGGIMVPCNWHLSADEVAWVLNNVRPPAPHPHAAHHANHSVSHCVHALACA